MSDFLTNLVARSFTPTPDLLRPKLPSLFEAPAGNEPVLEESLSINVQEEMAEAAPVSPTVNRSRLERYSVNENERATTPQAESEREAFERDRAVARRTILPYMPEEQPHAPIQIQSEEHVSAAQTVRAEDRPGERKQATGPRLEAVARSIAKSNKSELGQQAAARLVPVLPKLETSRPISESKNSMDAKRFPSQDRSPTVHIRIGRIEVRAVTQPSAPARAAVSNRPKMTLDEYLVRRNEGKR